MQGIVKWFSPDKGYGFITSDSEEDHYFNVQSVKGSELPSSGDKVSFESKSGNKGPRAFNVSIVEKSKRQIQRTDDRINCPNCNKRIVPRMILSRGAPYKSVCPYCAAMVKKFGYCFIATAVYGDPFSNELTVLREFRDEKLLPNPIGELLVRIYYRTSPVLANWLVKKPRMASAIRLLLNILVRYVLHSSDRSSHRRR